MHSGPRPPVLPDKLELCGPGQAGDTLDSERLPVDNQFRKAQFERLKEELRMF